MAEGWAHALKSGEFNAFSAGIQKHGLNPRAVAVMQEAGVDITNQTSNTLDEIDANFDLVITVCGHAHETCPVFPAGAKVVHVGFDDPPKLIADVANEEEALEPFRRVRDEIKAFVESLPKDIANFEPES